VNVGVAGRGRKFPVYISRSILDNPTIAEGWSAKFVNANSKCSRAVYGNDSDTARNPRYNMSMKAS
jgi:hypothetical protein